ncbi:hypothetical protein [Planomicrobium sp. CPCC 101079]|uniref:hypothetical protein n=1 Tax=Planomicrobium sp. CPCC 101079 TaxID=2599618 RepID=UPI0011B7CF98|nr:hypothetical protein [Planomicrobium sp. CPCC 101079]TWT09305.1 hypothetical protein FQV28_06635 [Planomicrobium sp. CPCC 101079]
MALVTVAIVLFFIAMAIQSSFRENNGNNRHRNNSTKAGGFIYTGGHGNANSSGWDGGFSDTGSGYGDGGGGGGCD